MESTAEIIEAFFANEKHTHISIAALLAVFLGDKCRGFLTDICIERSAKTFVGRDQHQKVTLVAPCIE